VCIGAYRCLSLCMDPYRWVSLCIRAYRYVSLRIVANRYVSVRIGAYRCVWIRIGGYQCVPVRIVTYRCESVRIGLYWCLSLCIVVYRCTPVRYRCCVSVRMDSYRWVSVRMGYSRCVTYGRIEGIGVSLRTRTYRCRIQLCMVSLLRIGVYGPVSVGTSPYWLQSVCNGTYRCVSVRMYWCVSNCGVSVYQCVLERIGAYLGPYQSLEVCGVGA
jgi:hypothetical protein